MRARDRHEADPLRVVAEQPAAAEITREELLAVGDALRLAHAVQPGTAPCVVRALDDEGARLAGEWIGVHLAEAVLVGAKEKAERVERAAGTEPDVARRALHQRRLEGG